MIVEAVKEITYAVNKYIYIKTLRTVAGEHTL